MSAVAAQLSPSARFARGAAFTALGAAFILRALGDTAWVTLSWLSPLGWSFQVRPYAHERWGVLLVHLAAAAVLTVVAYRLLAGRDVGAGLINERPGATTAGWALRGSASLAWRLGRGSLSIWTVGLCAYGLVIGGVVHNIGDQIHSPMARNIIARLGGPTALEQAVIVVLFTGLAMVAAALAISMTLRLHQEETSQRAETFCWPAPPAEFVGLQAIW